MKTINRRDFMGNTAKIVATTSVFPPYSFTEDKEPTSANKTRISLVGSGNRGIYACRTIRTIN